MRKKNICHTGEYRKKISRRDFLRVTGIAATSLITGYYPLRNADSNPHLPILLKNGTLINGTGAAPIHNGVVLIRDRLITAAGSHGKVQLPGHYNTIDLKGRAILPGFINAHVHGGYGPGRLRAWAQGGVTMVRDLSAFRSYSPQLFRTRDLLNTNIGNARLVAVGKFINIKGGYPIAYWGGTAVTVDSSKKARHAVNQVIDAGADVIKTAFESGCGFGQSGWPVLPEKVALALVEAAHERNKLVTAHVTCSPDLKLALDAGVDEIAHMVVDDLPQELIDRMVEKGTRWVPTLELWRGASKKYGIPHSTVSIDNLARFADAGGQVALGTDYLGAPGIKFDLGMPVQEIKLMKKAGMTPMQIIVAATKHAAIACDMSNTTGTIEKGKLADIVVLNRNPLSEMEAFSDIHMVIKAGHII